MISISTFIFFSFLYAAVYAVPITQVPVQTQSNENTVATTTFVPFFNCSNGKLDIEHEGQIPIESPLDLLIRLDGGYSTDLKNVYYYDILMPNVSIVLFQVLNYSYAKNVSNVYYKGLQILGALPKSFRIICRDYAKDAKNMYYKDQRIPIPDGAASGIPVIVDRSSKDSH